MTGSERWLDLDQWDAATKEPIDPAKIKGLPLYVGLDLSRGDDLCAAIFVYVAPDRIYVQPRVWLPRQTADEYEASNGTRFREWAKDGAITLLDETTISAAVQERIAAEIIAHHAKHPITAVCYDRAYSEQCIEAIKAANIRTEKVGQGWGVASGSAELERRLKEGSIVIEPNPVLRWNAENVEKKDDERGNFWPVKPNAKGKYAGTRSAKIDCITALVTALTEARKHAFPVHQQVSTAKAWIV